MSGISLTASMRSNLLSLQNIAGRQDIVQNRLATGLKVSSAIDNPSSYYTASSLNNRAADLTALLDAMSQGIQTIKAASEAIDSGTKFLEQAKAVANQALETAIPAKEWFAEQAGENGAVVETAQELLDAVNAGKETIVVYGKIELTDQTVTLKQGQKLVGTEYFTNVVNRNKDGSRFSQISITNSTYASGIVAGNNCLVSDIAINLTQTGEFAEAALSARGQDVIFSNLDVDFQGTDITTNGQVAISATVGGLTLKGNINIQSYAGAARGLGCYSGSTVTIDKDAVVEINMLEKNVGIYVYQQSTLNVYGTIKISNASSAVSNAGDGTDIFNSNNTVNIFTGAELFLENCSRLFYNGKCAENRYNQFTLYQDSKLSIKDFNGENYFISAHDYNLTSTLSSSELTLAMLLNQPGDFKTCAAFTFPSSETSGEKSSEYSNQFYLIIEQYNSLINDSSYKGINLLDGQNLKVNFNEDRSSKIDVAGVKADSDSLGLKTKEWKTAGDIEKSVSELENAINSLRSFASAFGNYYSIVTTRQDFTENLINVLEEGADKLTLADMNQETANMLALQTSQQLAVNSLSLASQASQSILKLF